MIASYAYFPKIQIFHVPKFCVFFLEREKVRIAKATTISSETLEKEIDLSVFADNMPVYKSNIMEVQKEEHLYTLNNMNIKLIPGVIYGIFVVVIHGAIECDRLLYRKQMTHEKIIHDISNLNENHWHERAVPGKKYRIIFGV